MPSLSCFHGGGGDGGIAESDKLGGFAMAQEDETFINCLSKEMFLDKRYGQTMIQNFGSDMTGFSNGGFVWTAEMSCSILAPAANMIGAMYRGTLSFGQLPTHL
jgi:hypothetical protein